MTQTVREVNAGGLFIDPSSALHWIAEAVERGHDKGSMRWLVSPQQLRSMHQQILVTSDAPQLRYLVEHGFPYVILFAGIPVAVSERLAPTEVILQEILTCNDLSVISGLSVTSQDYRREV